MTTFNKNKAPKGWMFPFNKKELHSLIEETNATFDSVEFQNTQKPSEYFENTVSCWFGVLTSEKTNNEYHFSLKLSSLKEEYVSPWKKEILSLVQPEITKWVKWKINQPLNSTEKPRQLFLKYEIKNGTFSTSCFGVD